MVRVRVIYESSHQDLHCLPFCFDFCRRPFFGTMVLTRFKDGRSTSETQGRKGYENIGLYISCESSAMPSRWWKLELGQTVSMS